MHLRRSGETDAARTRGQHGAAKRAVCDDRECPPQPRVAVEADRAATADQRDLPPRLPGKRLVGNAAHARIGVAPAKLRADTHLLERVGRDGERGAADAPEALDPAQPATGAAEISAGADRQLDRLLEEVAVPARS